VAAARLPDALFVGPQRAGTTWIHELLATRDDVQLPRGVKETYFFDLKWDRGREWYAGFFPASAAARVVEVGPSYFHDPAVPGRVMELLGAPVVVCTLRHPVERTHSLWVHMRRYGMTHLPFAEALDAHAELVDSSRYATIVERWQAAVGAPRVHVLFMEQLRASHQEYADAVCRILELPARPVPPELTRRVNEGAMPRSHRVARLAWKGSRALRDAGLHGVVNVAKRVGLQGAVFGSPKGTKAPPPTPEEQARLAEVFRPEIERLEGMLGVDLSHWKADRPAPR